MPDTLPSQVTSPVLGPSVSGTRITVDSLTKPHTVIPEIVRNLVADNEGYFAEEIFSTPGFTVEGGAIEYTESFPEDHFLAAGQGLAPRAPGSEAPRLGIGRHGPKIARPESLSGSIEVHDETRRRNQVWEVQNAFRRTANSFADTIQTRAVQTLTDFITATGREIDGVNWQAAHASGLVDIDPATLPQADFGKAINQFIADKAGVRPDLLLLHQDDALALDIIYPGEQLDKILGRYNLRLRVSPQVTEGQAIFAKSKQVGVIAFEKPLDNEYTREGPRKTDVNTLEATPVFVAIDASAVLAMDIGA